MVTIAEGLALLCLILFFILHFEAVKAFSSLASTHMGAEYVPHDAAGHRHPRKFGGSFPGVAVIAILLGSFGESEFHPGATGTYRVLRSLPQETRKLLVPTREKDPGYTGYKERLGELSPGLQQAGPLNSSTLNGNRRSRRTMEAPAPPIRPSSRAMGKQSVSPVRRKSNS